MQKKSGSSEFRIAPRDNHFTVIIFSGFDSYGEDGVQGGVKFSSGMPFFYLFYTLLEGLMWWWIGAVVSWLISFV